MVQLRLFRGQLMPRNPKVEFDMLKMYFGRPYVIDLENTVGSVTIYSPTIGDIVDVGEEKFYQSLNIIIGNTTQYRLMLWEFNIDWNEISDFQLFTMLYKQIDPEVCKLIFGDLDLQKFEVMVKQQQPQSDDEDQTGEIVMWNNEDQVEINADVHNHFSQYLRAVFNMFPEEKITHDNNLKSWYISKDRRAAERAKKEAEKGKHKSFSIQPLISACVNHPGFKYKLSELNEVGVMEFYDSVSRLQIYEQATALMKGMYSGFISAKDIKPEEYNFMREIVRDTNNSVSKAKNLKDQG